MQSYSIWDELMGPQGHKPHASDGRELGRWGATHLMPPRTPGSQPAFTFYRSLTLGSVGWVEGPVEVTSEFLLVLSVDQLKDALVHDICLKE